MKKALAVLVTVAMVFTLVAAIPGVSAAVEVRTWTLYDELLKTTKNFGAPESDATTVSGKADYSSSVFTVRSSTYTGGGLSDLIGQTDNRNASDETKPIVYDRNVTYNPSTGTVTFIDTRSCGQPDSWRGSLIAYKEGYCRVTQESPNQVMQIVFTAPTAGQYSIKPGATNKAGESLYTNYEFSSFVVATEKTNLLEYNIVKDTPNGFGSADKWVTLQTGDKLIFTVNPVAFKGTHEAGHSVYGDPKGINTYFNFTINLESPAKTEKVSTTYTPQGYASSIVPASAIKRLGDGGKYETEESAVVTSSTYKWGETKPASDIFGVEYTTPDSWGVRSFINSNPAFQPRTDGGNNYYFDQGGSGNFGKYMMSIAGDGTIGTVSNSSSIAWRVFFTAPEAGTYKINLGTVTAKAPTNQDAALWVYTDTYTDGTSGKFTGDASNLIINADFYEAKTNTLSPCADGPIDVTLAKGQRLYFEAVVNKNGKCSTSWGADIGLTFSLAMLSNETQVPVVNNDEITLDKDVITASGKLTATSVSGATNAKEIFWRSTNTSVATVDNSGNVTLVGAGHCYIIAYNALTEAKCLVNNDNSTIATGVTANEEELVFDFYGKYELVRNEEGFVTGAAFSKINLNDYVTLTPAGSVPKNLTFECDDTDVLTILDSGEIVIRGADTTTITVYLDGAEMDEFDVTFEEHECTLDNIIKEIPATCEEFGESIEICPVCGKTVYNTPISPKGHSWGEWTTTVEPGAGTKGEQKRTCSECTKEEIQALDAGIVDTVTIKTNPAKLVYEKGEEFDPTGMELTVTFTNYAHTQSVTDFTGVTFNYDFSNDVDETPVTFTFGGKALTLKATVTTKSGELGDVDKDGKIEYDDYEFVMKYVMGYSVPELNRYNADVNGDGAIDILDAIDILNLIAE